MATSPPLKPAPWRDLFLEHIQTMPTPEFVLSTARQVPPPSSPSASSGPTHAPRCRTCVFRGLFARLPVNPKNEAELNPAVYDSDLPTFTTDRRMDKMAELWESSGEDGAGAGKGRYDGSGGGAPVEAVWWAAEPKVQWRVRGRAYVLAPDVEASAEGRRVVSVLRSRMRAGSESSGEESQWSFAREITAHFGNLSPAMRGSFRNPPPGTPVAVSVDDPRLALGQKVTDLQDGIARGNFRLVVIVPEEVDRCDLSDPERARRWLYTFVGDGRSEPRAPGGEIVDEWEKCEVWP
ncbi:pyridoxamine 5'-phosphate oxidase-domain-containing protein [Whalleya microplaca]|nr:pyridoxamine 5'-phosphate oxidase-domain-containing protein [Whalleya microplaca]